MPFPLNPLLRNAARFLALSAAAHFLIPAHPGVHAREIERVALEEMEQDEVLRIANYFGAEQAGRRILVRSRDDSYDGLYYRLIFADSLRDLPAGAVVELSLLREESPDPVSYTMELPDYRPRGREIWIGLTGEDWTLDRTPVLPTAWKITITGPDGAVLVEQRSFVWGNR